MPVEIPVQIKKTLATLKSQMEKAGLEGTCLVSNDKIIYFTEQQSQVVEVPNLKRESDAQRLHSHMTEFLEDLRRKEVTPRSMESPPGRTWEEKMTLICTQLSMGSPYHISQLLYYYLLGTLMEEKVWNKEAKNVVKRFIYICN
ncbi:16234_t:CDS:1 [Cetraspora pellucida]|uniref:16234_t:CDS:1 n=1 Tax=Cetraspora pellucida TaxID=1433469 RepID=A0ACA9LYG6_9GLOM|nr:16234_t:CDS:1 [Cetraspora pellucida]